MKAAQYDEHGTFRVIDKGLRPLAGDEVLIRVEACGVCGTDLHIIEGSSRSNPPVVLGHEYYGIVHDTGTSTGVITEGMKVGVDPNIACGECFYCRRGMVHLCSNLRALGVDIDGGMADYSIVPVSQLHRLPDRFTMQQGVFIEPVSCAIHGIDIANVKQGDSVAVIGGGTIGLIMTSLARHAGAACITVIEPSAGKRDVAQKIGAHAVIDPAEENVRDAIFDRTKHGADVVIECVGKPETMQESLTYACRGGRIVFFGVCARGQRIPIEPYSIFSNELTIAGSYINPYTFERAIRILDSDIVPVDVLPSRIFGIDRAYDAVMSLHDSASVKNIIRPNSP
jgi:L-iditol 2-dehydrogenase